MRLRSRAKSRVAGTPRGELRLGVQTGPQLLVSQPLPSLFIFLQAPWGGGGGDDLMHFGKLSGLVSRQGCAFGAVQRLR